MGVAGLASQGHPKGVTPVALWHALCPLADNLRRDDGGMTPSGRHSAHLSSLVGTAARQSVPFWPDASGL